LKIQIKILKMTKILLTIIFLFNVLFSNAQVGIGNTTPKAQLDITASSVSAPITTDGLLIPRVTAFPSGVSADQNGMLVFLTIAFGSNQVGFYYYDFPTITWKWLASGNNSNVWINNNASTRIEIPKQSDGVTNRPLGNEVVVLDNGNVGFGMSNPLRHFQVNRDINAGTKVAVSNPNTGTSAFSQFTVEAKGITAYTYALNDAYSFDPTYPWFTAGNMLLQSTGVGGLSLGATNNVGFMNFFTGGRDESMRIAANGNVGIGTKNPLGPLHVSGSSASILLERFGIGSHFVGRTANGTQAAPTPLLANEIATRLSGWGYNGSTYLPVGNIDIMAEENQTLTTAGGYIKFTTTNAGGTASNEKMRITSAGNVGVNNILPTEKLDVTGNLKFSGAIMPNNLPGTPGQVLTSAGAGIAPAWNNPSSLSYNTTGATTGIYNVTLSQYTIRVFNAVSEIRLPNATGNQGKIFIIIGSNGIGTKNWTTSGGTIYDDVTNTTFTTISGSQRYSVQSDGTDWIVIGR
jgi:hypothetical protein